MQGVCLRLPPMPPTPMTAFFQQGQKHTISIFREGIQPPYFESTEAYAPLLYTLLILMRRKKV